MKRSFTVCALLALVCLGAALSMMFFGVMEPRVAGIWARALLAVAVLTMMGLLLLGRRAKAPAHVRDNAGFAVCATSDVDFSRVAANEPAKSSLLELADYLKHPDKYERLGARMPRGVLLYGPPGTGKTLLAQALAGEAGVPFFALSGSDFVQMYAGVGASRVRALFQKARDAGRAVIFIDEIDALGKKRDELSSDEREQTLNALLSEMSGFAPCPGTLVVAATNRMAALDPALLRPGRFDRQIEVGLPGLSERRAILRAHGRGKRLADSVDLDVLAARTVTFSGAALESLLNEAAILAAGRGADAATDADIERAYLSAVAGADRPSVLSQAERSVVALHEAGHALATHLLMPDHALTRVSILPTAKGAAGYSLAIPKEHTLIDRKQLFAQIETLLAGRAAELLLADPETLTGGAANDLARATDLAVTAALDLGLITEPYVSLRQLKRSLGGPAGAEQAVRTLLKERFEAVTALLERHTPSLLTLTQALLKEETLSGDTLARSLPSAMGEQSALASPHSPKRAKRAASSEKTSERTAPAPTP